LIADLRTENARLMRLLELTPREAQQPRPGQTGLFESPPGPVHAGSSPAVKVAFYRAMFAARADVYALRPYRAVGLGTGGPGRLAKGQPRLFAAYRAGVDRTPVR
jgi:hypothetical protein